jgi:hypothetical protein
LALHLRTFLALECANPGEGGASVGGPKRFGIIRLQRVLLVARLGWRISGLVTLPDIYREPCS